MTSPKHQALPQTMNDRVQKKASYRQHQESGELASHVQIGVVSKDAVSETADCAEKLGYDSGNDRQHDGEFQACKQCWQSVGKFHAEENAPAPSAIGSQHIEL